MKSDPFIRADPIVGRYHQIVLNKEVNKVTG